MKTVIIDPGHGGKFSGAISPSPRFRIESALVLDIAWIVRDVLFRHDIFSVLTRPNDMEHDDLIINDLKTRCWIANKYEGDLFVSIHANSTGKPSDTIQGYEVWHYKDSLQGQKAAEFVIDTFDYFLSKRLTRGVKETSDFIVLKKTKMPAILIEVGFLNNPEEDVWMHENKRNIGVAIAIGIVNYFKEY